MHKKLKRANLNLYLHGYLYSMLAGLPSMMASSTRETKIRTTIRDGCGATKSRVHDMIYYVQQ